MSDRVLEEAKQKMAASAVAVMKTNPPRDLDRAWKSVAMQYTSEFVSANYSELQSAFDEGICQDHQISLYPEVLLDGLQQ